MPETERARIVRELRTLKTPNCDKLAARIAARAAISFFAEYLQERGYRICELPPPHCELYLPVPKSIDAMFYEAYGIDAQALEQERRRLLELQRQLNETPKDEGAQDG